MKQFINRLLVFMLITGGILYSYQYISNKNNIVKLSEVIEFFKDDSIRKKLFPSNTVRDKKEDKNELSRSVWLSYIEFEAYCRSTKNNDEEHFRAFYKQVLEHCKKYHIDNIIVQVRPFSDSLYPSKIFPWASCISGKQGLDPRYDPLAVMIEMTHKEGLTIDAWINPYRISSANRINQLSANHPARLWSSSNNTKRYVLEYENALYFNPAIPQVRSLIVDGVREIITQYKVDGIHMDDYFYPSFSKDNMESAFDAPEYEKDLKQMKHKVSIEKWRRNNVNMLVSEIYSAIKEKDTRIRFGISPAGNIGCLRSDYQYYTDIDSWISKGGYIDYIMPQVYWGFQHEETPFDHVVKQWINLTKHSDVDLYIGVQLYRFGTSDHNLSDYQELQSESLLKEQIDFLDKKRKNIQGYCLYSYQYLDCDSKMFDFASTEFGRKRKAILEQIAKYLEKQP